MGKDPEDPAPYICVIVKNLGFTDEHKVKDVALPKVSAKRQITLPIDQCRVAGIEPGDEYQSFVDNNGHISIVKKVAWAAHGLLSGVKGDSKLSDDASMQSGISE